jgi:glycine cleavage system H lipoate-binding protein/ABC-type phosphate transport system substrate-binding protein
MKKLVVLISFMALLVSGMSAQTPNSQEEGARVQLLVNPDLSELVNKWITEYSASNPDIEIKQFDIGDKSSGYDLKQQGVLGIVAEEDLHSMDHGSLWSMVVARDVIVPVVSSKNPFAETLGKTGISPGKFTGAYADDGVLTWGKITGTGSDARVNCYALDDESYAFCLSQFMGSEGMGENVRTAADNSELIEDIKNDSYAIAFCRLSGLIDYQANSIREGLKIVPIDINGNGVLDQNENIYTCLNDFNRGVWIGKYPGSLCRNIHIVSGSGPVDTEATDFIRWVLSDGQTYISEAGFSELIPGERQPKLQALNTESVAETGALAAKPVNTARIFLIAASILLAGMLVYVLVKLFTAGTNEPGFVPAGESTVFGEKTVKAPGGIFFDRTHTWAFMEKEGKVKIGVDDFLQHTMGKITRVDIKAPGSEVRRGERLATLIQNGKKLDIYSPLSGVVSEVNDELSARPALINSDPYSGGWIYKIEPANWIKETKRYFMGDSYIEWLNKEFSRLKDFIASAVRQKDLNYSQVVLQDGGEIKEGLMENFGPDVWEELQRKFIDTSV